MTGNTHKAAEMAAIAGRSIAIKNLNDIGFTDDIPETGNTFKANASQKSRFIFERFGINCFADDSGLEVEALNNEPGVYSVHYSGTRDPETNLQLVLDKLAGSKNRKARFITVISLIIDGNEYFFEGIAEGKITEKKAGTAGFGYDPIFKPDGYAVTFAEMSIDEKNRISHRAKALEKLVGFVEGY